MKQDLDMKEMNRVPEKSKGISWQDFGTGMIVLNPNKEKVHQLNGVAMDIFELIDGEKSLLEIKEKMMDIYDVEEERLLIDLDSFLKQAKEWEIIH